MGSKLHWGRLAMCCLSLALPVAAQLDSSALRAKYGAPLNRETFAMPQGFNLVVDYGAGYQVCRLEVPSLMPADKEATVSNTSDMKQRMVEFLAELFPSAMRGKKVGEFMMQMGAISMLLVEYEHVSISEPGDANQPFGGTTTVTFKGDNCRSVTGR